MRIIICSDIHDNIWKLDTALKMMRGDTCLFCGDFCAPFTLAQLAAGFTGPIHVVFGNNDGDQRLLVQNAQQAGNVTIHGQFAELEFEGTKIAINHYPELARRLAVNKEYDLVCYGHDHRVLQETVGACILVNPGDIMGRFGRSTFMTYETTDRSLEIVDVQ